MHLQEIQQTLRTRWSQLNVRRITRRVLTTSVLAMAGLAATVWYLNRQNAREASHSSVFASDEKAAPFSPASGVLLVTLSRTPLWIEATGTVRAELEATVGTKVSGRVLRVLVREGDLVRRGQPVVQLDARDFDAAILQADANLRAAQVGRDTARVSATMEDATSKARIAAAQAQLGQADAALQAAVARKEQVESGPRKQERASASLAVAQAKSNLVLAESNRKRMAGLVAEGAISQQYFDTIQAQYEVAKAQYESARQSESMTGEGSRAEEIRGARETVRQAQAALELAKAGVQQAKAGAMQTAVRRQEIAGAEAQIGQSRAAREIAAVTRDYATLVAPFDGVVTQKLADPGSMAGPGAPLLKIQGGAIRLEAVVPESALGRVRQGIRLPVRLDALGEREVTGVVREIAPQGDAASHTFLVKIDLPPGMGARAGMFGRARLQTGVEEALLVPASAVTEREGLRYVQVVDPSGKAQLRLVTVGEPRGGRIPVLSGLNAGEKIRRQ